MKPDFYVDRRGLAGYFEKEWFDHVLSQSGLPSRFFEYAPFDPTLLFCDSHEKTANFLSRTLTGVGVAPQRLLEVGAALGRGFYEVCQRTPSLRAATLVEPSRNLASTFDSLFRGNGSGHYPVLTGNTDVVEVTFDSASLREAVQDVEISLLNTPHEQMPEDLGIFNLVTCFNVLDNSTAPLALVERLKRHTAPGGILALSCTYQWTKKYLGTETERAEKLLAPATETPTQNINDLFGEGWTRLDETNIEFKFRRVERHWQHFVSHVVVFRKD